MKRGERQQNLLQPEITESVSAEIETTYRYLRRRALIGRLSPQAGTVFEQGKVWRSCMDLVSHDRADPQRNNLPPPSPGLPDSLSEVLSLITETREKIREIDHEDFLDGLVVALEVMKRSGQLLTIPRSSLERWPFRKVFSYQYNDERGQVVISRAMEGDQVAHDVIRAIARDYLLAGDEVVIPPNLRRFVLMSMYGIGLPQSRKRKKEDPAKFTQRDLELAKAISDVLKRTKLKPYASRTPVRRPQASATWVVWKAADRLKLGVGLRHVEECWRLRSRLAPTGLLDDHSDQDTVLITLDGEVVWSEAWNNDPESFEAEVPQIGIGSRLPLRGSSFENL